MFDWYSRTENQMRDAIFADPVPLLLELGYAEEAYKHRATFKIWREFETAAGYCDLFIAFTGHAIVVEIKRVVAIEAAVGQCLRYMHEIDDHLPYHKRDAQMRRSPGEFTKGVILAPKIDDNAQRAAGFARIDAVEYQGYQTFEVVYGPEECRKNGYGLRMCMVGDRVAGGIGARLKMQRVHDIRCQLRAQGIKLHGPLLLRAETLPGELTS